MACTDYQRHERLLDCRHPATGVQAHVELADGCSGRVCQDCLERLGIKGWPDLADRGPGHAPKMRRALAAMTRINQPPDPFGHRYWTAVDRAAHRRGKPEADPERLLQVMLACCVAVLAVTAGSILTGWQPAWLSVALPCASTALLASGLAARLVRRRR